MKVTAKLSNVRLTPRKARLVAGLIQGMSAGEATVQLEKMVKKSAGPILKLLRSAMANATNNFSLDEKDLFVSLARVNEGRKLKRWMPRAHGRATPIWRRLSHITIVLDERSVSGGRDAVRTEEVEPKVVVAEPAIEKESPTGPSRKKRKAPVKRKSEPAADGQDVPDKKDTQETA